MNHLNKYIISLILILLIGLPSYSQEEKQTIVTDYSMVTPINGVKNFFSNIGDWCKYHDIAQKLDAGISLSSMGLGLELGTSATKWADVRVGIDWMPSFSVPLYFNLNTFSDGSPTSNFNNVAKMVYRLTGIEMDETVHMNGRGQMVNFKLMVDVFPVPSNRHWRVTAGFFAGTSRIAKAYSSYEEKPTLVGLNIYNRAYEYFTNLESVYDVPLGGGNYMDPQVVRNLQKRFSEYGRMGIHIGDFKDGTPYIMDPAPDGTISAQAFVNHFKPYLGAGYSTSLDREKNWNLSIDLGAVFWGGAPKIINHDYKTGKDINFTKDLINLKGKVANYVKTCKSFPVYPLVAVRISYSIL